MHNLKDLGFFAVCDEFEREKNYSLLIIIDDYCQKCLFNLKSKI